MGSTNPNTVIGYNKARILSTPGEVLKFPQEDIPYKMLLSFTKYSFATSAALITGGNNQANMVKNPAGSVVLPLPLQLNDSTNVNATVTSATYAQMLNNFGENGLNNTGAFNSVDDWVLYADLMSKAALAGGAGLVKKGSDPKKPNVTTAFAGELLGAVGAAVQLGLSDQSQIYGGWAMNPFETMQFKGVDLKTHSFSWKLSPSSVTESNILRDIINKIKANMLPTYYDTTAKSAHSILNYPAIANISFYGIDQNYYYMLKPCMITDFNISYNGGDQLNIYRGGKPAVIELQMKLTEMTIHTADDYGRSNESPGIIEGPVNDVINYVSDYLGVSKTNAQ